MKTTKKRIRTFIQNRPISSFVQWLKSKHHRVIGNRKLTGISIENLRCQKTPFSKRQGFSGKKIDHFPPCRFYRKCLKEPVAAELLFFNWLRDCLLNLEAFKIPRSEGGWAHGSIMREITRKHAEHGIYLTHFEKARSALIDEAISTRVAYYFDLFNSIRNHGYDRLRYPPIRCYGDRNHCFIENGHHRVAAMYVLDYEDVEVFVLPTRDSSGNLL